MKVGSLVEFVGDPNEYRLKIEKNGIYTVREIFKDPPTGDVLIALEEIHGGINPNIGLEFGWDVVDFREIQPPMTINIEELISEPQTLEHATF